MESTLTHPCSTSETPNPAGFSPPRKRPRGALKGIGFILAIWVQQIFSKGLLPTQRSVSALMAIANVVDVDGRWCFFFLENLAKRSGGTLSVSSLKRAIDDLTDAGIVRKLTRSETIAFFAEDLKPGRSTYQLPCVLELLVPAEDYPELALSEINACRAQLGEEPLTTHNRPSLSRRSTLAQVELTPSSDRPTDCSPSDCSGEGVAGSVRGTSTTGKQTRKKTRIGLFGIIDRIPNKLLSAPRADRERLALAVEKLLRQGLGEADVRVLLSGLERLWRPFPALMKRLCDMRAARRYLDGTLGRGIHGARLPTPPWSDWGEDDPFTQSKQFLVDSRGKASGTCPEHPTVRNIPGDTCAICGRLCRSVPDELMHEPAPEPNASPQGGSVPEIPEHFPPEDVALGPKTLGQIAASLNDTGRTPADDPVPRGGFWLPPGPGLSPNAQTVAAWARERIKKAHKPTDLD
ncbi:hypothetical protein GCM10027590_14350 [Nocardiopsis nanhaiensis]